MSVKLLTEQCLELLSLKRGCTGSSEATHVKIPHCWKSRVTAHICQSLAYTDCLRKCLYFILLFLFLSGLIFSILLVLQDMSESVSAFPNFFNSLLSYTNMHLLSCQPRVTVTSYFVYNDIMDLESIDHLSINLIHRIGLILK